MATAITAYQHIADVSLWLKLQSSDTIVMADIPDLIALRWPQFRDKWSFLVDRVYGYAEDADNPDQTKEKIDKFTEFIAIQRLTSSQLNPFSDKAVFYRYYDVWKLLPLDIFPINNNEQDIINTRIAKIRAYTKSQFLSMKNDIRSVRDEKADVVGISDNSYNSVYNRSSVAEQTEASISDVQTMKLYQDAMSGINFILANIRSLDTVSIDPFALLKANANNPDIPFELYSSGRLVKMNYGEDLKTLAQRYLNDADKWMEIAVANGLRPPYIDEVGSTIDLLSNANGNKINLDATDADGNPNIEKLYIDQIVILRSDTEVNPDQRKIVDIYEVPVSGEIIVELNGDDDLSKYTVTDHANVRIYKRNTINSGFYVLIPSNDPINPETYKDIPWFLQASAADEKQAKVDLMLDENGDIIFTATSDVQLSYGLDNAIQAIKLKLATESGELSRHPEYGLIAIQGNKNIDITAIRQAIIESINFNIENDTRYDRVERLNVEYFNTSDSRIPGTMFLITLEVKLSGGSAVVPISFVVNVT